MVTKDSEHNGMIGYNVTYKSKADEPNRTVLYVARNFDSIIKDVQMVASEILKVERVFSLSTVRIRH